MTRRCCIVGCKSNTNKKVNYINTFSFPKDPVKRALWIKAINRKDFVPDNRSFVCVKHFEEKDLVRKASKFKSGNGGYVVKKIRFQLLNEEVSPTIFPYVPEHVSYVTTQYKPRKADSATTVLRSSSKRKAALKCSETWRRLYNLKEKIDKDDHYSSSSNESISDNSTDGQEFFTSRLLNVTHDISEDGKENDDKRPLNMHFHKKFGLVKYYSSDNASSNMMQDTSNQDNSENSDSNVNLISPDNIALVTGYRSPSNGPIETDSKILRGSVSHKSNNISSSCIAEQHDEKSNATADFSSNTDDTNSNNLSRVLQVRLERIDETSASNLKSDLPACEVESSIESEDCDGRTDTDSGISDHQHHLSPLCPKMKFVRNLNLRMKRKSDDENSTDVDGDTVSSNVSHSRKRFSAMKSVFTWRQLLNIQPNLSGNTSKRSPSKKTAKAFSPQQKKNLTSRRGT